MGRLVNCGPGEWSDRLTILALKILVGSEQGKDVTHFKSEQAALLTSIRSRTLNGKWFDCVLELGAVNGQLWQTEDHLRELRTHAASYEKPDSTGNTFEQERTRTALKVQPVAFRLQALNDRRAVLVQQINKDAGDGEIAEKI